MSSSWKTTVCGILGIIAAAITMIGLPLLDSDPVTVPNYTAFVATATTAIGLLFARDNDKTSLQVGAGRI